MERFNNTPKYLTSCTKSICFPLKNTNVLDLRRSGDLRSKDHLQTSGTTVMWRSPDSDRASDAQPSDRMAMFFRYY